MNTNTLESIWNNIIDFLPTLIGIIIVLVVGFIVAKIVAKLVKSAMKKADKKMSRHSGREIRSAHSVSKFVYYILVVIVLLIALSILGVEGVLSPLENMLNEFLLFIPNLIAALIIGYIGYILAKVISEIGGSLTRGLQSKSRRIGVSEAVKLDKIITPIIFILIFVPILIVALDTLQMNAISEPATDMLYGILTAIPEILAGIVILAIFYAIAKFLAPMVTNILREMGAEKLVQKWD